MKSIRGAAVVKIVALGVALPLALAACSSGKSTSSDTSTSTSAGTSAGTTAAAANLAKAYAGTSETPPTGAPKSTKTENVWVISCGQQALGCSKPVAGAVAAAQALGWKTNVFDGNFGASDAFNTGIRQAIAAKATAILVIGVDCSNAKASLTEAKAAKIPVIAGNSYDCNDPALNAGSSLFSGLEQFASATPSSAEFNSAIGVAKADWLIVATQAKAKVIELELNGVTGYHYQNAGFEKEMATCSGCSIVTKVSGNPPDLSTGVLKQSFATALTAHPTANAVYAPGDSIVTAAAVPQALQGAGRTTSVKVIGTEGFDQNLDLIRQNRGQNAAMPYDGTWIGWGLVDETLRVLAGKPTVPEGIGYKAIDSTHNLPASGTSYADSVDFVSAYKKAWGV